MASTDPFRILAICTGNICRSPAMEAMLAAELADDRAYEVESAGTEAMTGWPAEPTMARLLHAAGIELGRHRARQVDPDLTRRNDLILTASFAHREWISATTPAAARRTFTLAEFAEIAGDAPAELSRRELVAWAAEHRPPRPIGRARSTRRGGAPGDIIDPYGRADAVFAQSIAQIEPLTKAVAAALRTRS
ncbi:hypothetical protein [Leifsonia sp. C5G2]|uniref:arsenate reductase/protein-tyrosine-phosphatase family protein n=1 Tax=Leifsonia sp. C5G2 TaxID=2735269 RepID=UPI001584775C|nr:hypothetical protein [Leifsonia sp. C5G2]NUU07325.1 hypothetical protein [Leifsonia sp. C5G2]